MKKIGILLASLLIAGTSFAGTVKSSGNCGCGIGTMALGDQPDTVLSQLAATFLNGICGNGTFGITSGTLECTPASGIAMNSRVKQYVADNMDHVALDIAMGRGASLNALADLMNVPAAKRTEVFAKLQNNFDKIFTSDQVGAEDVVQNMATVLNG